VAQGRAPVTRAGRIALGALPTLLALALLVVVYGVALASAFVNVSGWQDIASLAAVVSMPVLLLWQIAGLWRHVSRARSCRLVLSTASVGLYLAMFVAHGLWPHFALLGWSLRLGESDQERVKSVAAAIAGASCRPTEAGEVAAGTRIAVDADDPGFRALGFLRPSHVEVLRPHGEVQVVVYFQRPGRESGNLGAIIGVGAPARPCIRLSLRRQVERSILLWYQEEML